MSEAADRRVPVCVLTGFLGAGKSTLLNFDLQQPGMQGTAVVINEYGSVPVDHHLVESAPDDTELIADGCICCTARGLLAEALMNLFQRAQRRQFSLCRLIVETTGLAEPGPILSQLISHPQLKERFVVDSVVTLIDAANGGSTFDTHDIAVQQVTGADRLMLTKTDLVDDVETLRLEQRLKVMNPDARIEMVLEGAVQPEQLFSGAYRRASAGTDLGSMFQRAGRLRFRPDPPAQGSLMIASPSTPAEQDIQTFSLVMEKPIPPSTFFGWLNFLRSLCGPSLLRVKGLVHLHGQALPTIVHGVQNVFHPSRQLPAWPSEDRRTRLVFITRGWGQDAVNSTLVWLDPEAAQNGLAVNPM